MEEDKEEVEEDKEADKEEVEEEEEERGGSTRASELKLTLSPALAPDLGLVPFFSFSLSPFVFLGLIEEEGEGEEEGG